MKILDWRDKKKWTSDLNSYAKKILNKKLVNQLLDNDIKGCWADDMSWLPEQNIVKSFKKLFEKFYTHIKCFHGSRPINVSSYYENGLVGQNRDVIESQFRELFSDVDINLIEKCIEKLNNRGESEKGKIYFACNDNNLIEDSGHYLIQGSEYIMSLATCLVRQNNHNEDFRLRLREIGIPTIFEVDIPLEYIPGYQINELVQSIIAAWGNQHLFPDEYHDHEMGFVIYKDIEPSNIVDHWHPKRIKDPHSGHVWYYSEVTVCEMCML
jgi:hypothetical protein